MAVANEGPLDLENPQVYTFSGMTSAVPPPRVWKYYSALLHFAKKTRKYIGR